MRINQTTPAAFAHIFNRRADDVATSRQVEQEIVPPGSRSGGGFREDRAAPPGMMLMPMLLKVQEVASRVQMDADFANIRAQAAETRAARGDGLDFSV
ncbi:MAG: hypothetical protein Alpg2KO_19160 [Alphaproteobacteria bacterium]